MVKYSFLVAVYNVEKYLRKCLDTLLAQNYPCDEFEIILVDDGSTDSSSYICDEYQERFSNLRVIHKENEGLMQARKSGILESKGLYSIFVDSDDFVVEDMIRQIDELIEMSNPDFLMYSYYRFEEKNNLIKPSYIINDNMRILSKKEMLSLFVSSSDYNGISGKVVKTKILKDHIEEIYQNSFNLGEDRVQTAYLIKYSSVIALTNMCLMYYRIREDSIIHNKKLADLYEQIRMCEIVKRVVKDIMLSENVSEYESDIIENKHNLLCLSVTLEHIYKYNKNIKEDFQSKFDGLSKLMEMHLAFFLPGGRTIQKLKIYNRIRYLLLIRKQYRILINLDKVISVVQNCLSIHIE